jgi:hypothetical protein
MLEYQGAPKYFIQFAYDGTRTPDCWHADSATVVDDDDCVKTALPQRISSLIFTASYNRAADITA